MLYLIQVSVYTGLMCLVYILFLSNKPLHAFNRAYLLLCVFLPLVLPLLSIPGAASSPLLQKTALGLQLPEFVVSPANKPEAMQTLNIGLIVYAGVAACLLSVLGYQLIKLKGIVSKHNKVQQPGYTIINNTGYGPGSWFGYILLPEGGVEDAVIKHEMAHVKHHHTVDIIAVSIVQAMCWPNLFLIWIKKELKQVHEFQADAAIETAPDEYADLLLSALFKTCTLPNTHSFIIHPIKRRIMMLNKNGRKKWNALNVGLAVITSALVLTSIIGVQSCKAKKFDVIKKETDTAALIRMVNEELAKNGGKYADFVPEHPAEFIGGQHALMDYLSKNIKYPEESRKLGVEGRIVVEFGIDGDGKILDPVVLNKNADPLLAAEALRVVKGMPLWKPAEDKGHIMWSIYQLPISFKLS